MRLKKLSDIFNCKSPPHREQGSICFFSLGESCSLFSPTGGFVVLHARVAI